MDICKLFCLVYYYYYYIIYTLQQKYQESGLVTVTRFRHCDLQSHVLGIITIVLKYKFL